MRNDNLFVVVIVDTFQLCLQIVDYNDLFWKL